MFFFFFNCYILAQEKTEIITHCKQFKYCYQNEFYTKKSLSKIIVINEDAHKNYKKFKGLRNTSLISVGVTLTVIGLGFQIPCGGDEEGGEACQARRGIVGGLGVLVALPTFLISRVKFLKAIRLFNEGQNPSIGKIPMQLDLKYTENGIGLVLTF